MTTDTFLNALAGASLVGWLYLLLGHGGYWRADQRLPVVGADPASWPEVVAIVPARDEAGVLPETLPTLVTQDYPGEFRVVLVDDGSSDGTGDVARRLAEAPGPAGEPARRVSIVRPGEPTNGWAGKVWAQAEGVAVADQPTPPSYLLFTDADIAHAPGMLTALVRAAEADRRDLVSQMAILRARTRWERVLVPAFVYFFAQLYPFRWVNRPGRRTAAAAGGCVLVRRAALSAGGGLTRIRGALIDDVALGRLVKRSSGGGRIWLGLTTEVASCRAYPRLADLWAMVARSAYTQLMHSPPLLAATVVGLVLVYVVPPVAATAGLVGIAIGSGEAAGWPLGTGVAAWAVMAATYVPTLRLYRLSPLRGALLPVVALLYAAMTIDSARRHLLGRGGAWKGRVGVGRGARPPT